MVSFILPGNSASSGYEVSNSLRFNGASSDYLSHSPSSASNRRTWTLSFWTKRASLGQSGLFGGWTDGNYQSGFASMIYFNNSDQLEFDNDIAGADYTWNTDMMFKDLSAWYNIVIAIDTTQSTEANRQKVYVNGSQVSLTESALGFPTQNFDTFFNNELTVVSSYAYEGGGGTVDEYSGYMAEVVMIDGQQLDATSFGEFDSNTNIWVPIDVSGLTFGTNGFYLEFKQTGTSQNSSGMGADTSGNDNHFAVSNLTSVDQSTDTCTNNYATLNPLQPNNGAITYSEGNLKAVAGSGSTSWTTRYAFSSIGVSAGRWYMEAKCVDSGGSNQFYFGIAKDIETWAFNSSLGYESTGQGWGYYANNGNIVNNQSDLYTSGNSYTDGDIISMELDLEDMTLDFYKNGVKEGYQVTSLPAGTYHFAINGYAAIDGEFNFGSPNFSISSGNSDANGYGNFEYSVPSGHYALNTKNLAEYG